MRCSFGNSTNLLEIVDGKGDEWARTGIVEKQKRNIKPKHIVSNCTVCSLLKRVPNRQVRSVRG